MLRSRQTLPAALITLLAVLLLAQTAPAQITTYFGPTAQPAIGFGPGFGGWAVQVNVQPPSGEPDVRVVDGSGATMFGQSFAGEDVISAFLVKTGNSAVGDPAVLAVITGHDNPSPSVTTYSWTVRLIALTAAGGAQFYSDTETEYALTYKVSVGMGSNAVYVEWRSSAITGVNQTPAHHRLHVISMDFGTAIGVPMPGSLSTPGSVFGVNNDPCQTTQDMNLFVLHGPYGDLLALRSTYSGLVTPGSTMDPKAHLIVTDLRTPSAPTVVYDGRQAHCRTSNFGLMADSQTFVVIGVRDLPCGTGVTNTAGPGSVGAPPGTGGFQASQWASKLTGTAYTGNASGNRKVVGGAAAAMALGIGNATWMSPSAWDFPSPSLFANTGWATLQFAFP